MTELIRSVTFPFILERVTGLSINLDRLHLVEMRRTGKLVSIVKADSEDVMNNNIGEALSNILSRTSLPHKWVTVQLPIEWVTFGHIIVDDSEDEDEIQEQVYFEVRERLITAGSLEDYIIRYEYAGVLDKKNIFRVACVEKEHVENLQMLLQSHNLVPLCFSTGLSDVDYVMSNDRDFHDNTTLTVDVTTSKVILSLYQYGQFTNMSEVPLDPGNGLYLEDIITHLVTVIPDNNVVKEIKKVFISESALLKETSHNRSNIIEYENKTSYFSRLEIISELHGINFKDKPLNYEYIYAVAAGYRQLDYLDDGINFLTTSEIDSTRNDLDKRSTMFLILAVGLILFVILGTLNIWSLQSQKTASNFETQHREVLGNLAAIENMRDDLRLLRSNIANTERLMSNQLLTAGILELTGRAIPNGLWLTNLRIDISQGDNSTLELTGVTELGRTITQLIEELEQIEAFNNVRLKYTQTVPERVYRRDFPDNKLRLEQFELSANIVSSNKATSRE